MKYRIAQLGVWVALLAGCATNHTHEADPNTLTRREKADGWKLLFDGEHTSGWRAYAHANFPSNGWIIEDGCLKDEGGKHGGDIVTREQFTDFDLKFDWRISGRKQWCQVFGQGGQIGQGRCRL